MTESPLISGTQICMSFREKAMRARAAEDEKVIYILGCPTIVKRGPIGLTALRVRKAVIQAFRGTGKLAKV